MSTRPWPEVKLVTRPPATAKPSQTAAAECSLSGSKNISGSPHRFFPPFMTAALNPPPMVVELVIGYAPAAWATLISTWTTASAPSQVVGMPGYSNFVVGASRTGSGVLTGGGTRTLLMIWDPFLGATCCARHGPNFGGIGRVQTILGKPALPCG